jgi:hypothetical protein
VRAEASKTPNPLRKPTNRASRCTSSSVPDLQALAGLQKRCLDVTQRVGVSSGVRPLPPPMYSSLTLAHKALRTDQGYQWLCHRLPKIMARAPTNNLPLEFRFVGNLNSSVLVTVLTNGAKESRGREDKKRHAVLNDIETLMQRLFTGTAALKPDTLGLLLRILDVARYELRMSQARKKPVKHPTLQNFAQTFLQPYSIADPELLMEFADATGLVCDIRTAQRYIRAKRK